MNRIAGEIALKSPAPDTEKAEKHFERALALPADSNKIMGTARRNRPRTPLARPGQGETKRANCWLRCTGGLRRGLIRVI